MLVLQRGEADIVQTPYGRKGFIQGSEMKKQRESQCTQKTISLLSPLGTIQVRGCENGVHTIQILMDVAPAESRVLQVLLRDVKFGETVSYKRLAEMAGTPRAAQAVGGAMRRNPVPLLIPCHRVISSSGQSGPYMSGKGDHLKQWLLTHERQGREG
ncbi:methylated-DNA--protein-cysteine methyltransferase isoform X3 [Notothenia coriiceps]|uniref:Methylated-DNA--protein-cysteine methyltransferase n=1 Tax=Notothenia coriiceps TaxID=8208 RepID=A0A6I9P4M8_9TELE|nr:PREDICTED: methylated-DNA--protein-cysteine methyltransferase isoform X3 [Notothenia coriiceps]